ncbi:MAG TPA: aldo/keto reductase [Solirubrobacterales bacterium]|nr:aldo/keto reductase [Solirubrobacterales bacterium]
MTNATEVPVLTLHDGVEIPQLGFGVFQIPPEETQEKVEEALGVGYRHVDTAAAYRNEAGVGAAIAASGVRRDDVFVTTKLWNSEQGYDSTLRAFEKSVERLGTGHVDLYLIHWPLPSKDLFLDTWRAFERIQEEGGARSIGVSNFRVEDLERIEEEAEKRPTVNQIELHPRLQQAELRAWHADHEVATEAWPAGAGRAARRRDDRNRRRPPRPHPGAGDPALAPTARQRRDPQIVEPGADPGELRGLRLRAERGRHGGARTARCRRADRAGPRQLQRWIVGRGRGCPFQTHLAYGSMLSVWQRHPRPLLAFAGEGRLNTLPGWLSTGGCLRKRGICASVCRSLKATTVSGRI